MIGKILAFWILWFIISIFVGRIFPETIDNASGKKKIIAFGNGIIGFIITVIILVAFQALI